MSENKSKYPISYGKPIKINSILDEIVREKRERIERQIHEGPGPAGIKEKARSSPPAYDFYKALVSSGSHLSLIAEIKRASPSRGMIRSDLDPAIQARAYQEAGASALSVITEEDHFHGSLKDLAIARQSCAIPILRKDFILHPFQVYEARAFGADAILLIAAILDDQDLFELAGLAAELGMHALVEVHDAKEIPSAIRSGTKIIGINNRDLSTFHVDINTTARLAPLIPKDFFLVSESGVSSAAVAKQLASWGAKAVLAGEALVTSPDINGLIKSITHIKCEQE
ncbi:indole-3-glycerol phosphate synthase TrpC [bacterium]|nr:indole-3-glycerol phosphate synthase TrpC [bacterium]